MGIWSSKSIKQKVTLALFAGVIYFVAAKMGLRLVFENTNSSPIWPPTGLALAAILLFGIEIWPGIFLGAFFANFLIFQNLHLPLHITVLAGGLTAVGNTLEAVVGVALFHKFYGRGNPFSSLNGTISFIFLCAFLATIISATFGTFTFVAFSGIQVNIPMMWSVWWTGDAIGAIIIVPVFLNWKALKRFRWAPVKIIETVGFFTGLTLYYYLVFILEVPIEYFVIPLLVWSALRFNIFLTSLNILLISIISIYGTVSGHGPFLRHSLTESLAMLQIFTAMIALSTLVLSVILAERKEALQALQINRGRFRALIEGSPIAIAVTRNNLITYANSKFIALFSPNLQTSFVGFSILERIQPEDARSFLSSRQIAASAEFTDEVSFETKAVKLDGSNFPASITTSMVGLDDGFAEMVYVQDITLQKKTEASLRESQQMLQLVFDTIPLGIHWKNRDSVYQGCNRRCAVDAELRSPADIVGKTDFDLPWANFAALYQSRDKEVLITGKPILNYEQPRTSSSGNIYLLRQNKMPLLDIDGTIIGILTVYEDITEWKKTAQALEQSEQNYRELVENTSSIITRWNAKGEMTFINDFGTRFFGYTLEELVGKPVIGTLVPEISSEGENLRELIDNIFSNPEHYKYVINENITKDGARVWIEWRNQASFDEDGNLSDIFSIGLDITERKIAENALLESERRLSTLVSNLPGVAYRCLNDGDWTIEYISQGCYPLTGYMPDDFIMHKVLAYRDIVHPEYRSQLSRDWDIAITNKGTYQGEYPITSRDGELKWVWEQGCAIYANGNDVIALEGFITDITDRKRAVDALGKSETQYRTLFESAQDAIFVLENQIYIDCNPASLRMFACERGDFIGESPLLFSPEFQSDNMPSSVLLHEKMRYAQEGIPQFFEWRHMQLNGTEFDAEVYINQMNIKSKNLLLVLVRDITERKRAERHIQYLVAELQENSITLEKRVVQRTEELAIAKERAESADRLKSAFLATMSHELRTPLNSIIGFTGIILRELAGPLNEEQKKQLRMANNSAQHLLALINDVLDISKIEAGQLEVTFKEFDFAKSIEMVVTTLRPLAEKKQLELKLLMPPVSLPLESDKRRVEQVFLNLINNAIKFTDHGCVAVTVEIDGNTLRTKIVDTGIGIHKDNLEHIFEPFKQVDSGLSRVHEGTGLGLSICRALLQKLNGNITIESTLGYGTSVFVSIPIKSGVLHEV